MPIETSKLRPKTFDRRIGLLFHRRQFTNIFFKIILAKIAQLLCRSQCLSQFLFKMPELVNRILLAYLPFIKVLHHWLSIRETSATSPFSLTSSLSRSITVLSSTSIESSTFPFLMYFRDQLWDRISTIFFIHSVNKTWTVRIAS